VVEGKKLLQGGMGWGNGQPTHNERVLKGTFILRKLYMASDTRLETAMILRCTDEVMGTNTEFVIAINGGTNTREYVLPVSQFLWLILQTE
jgi:hypothetical protein